MTALHSDPEYRKNAAIVRAQVKHARAHGNPVYCWRCGRPIGPDQRYDVGHKAGRSNAIENLAPEHRGENRAAGGRQGAAVQARSRARASRMLPW